MKGLCVVKKIYKLKKVEQDLISEKMWQDTPFINIDVYPWENNGYKPAVEVRMLYSNLNLHIYFKVYEKQIKASYVNLNDPVCKDSCVEFFFNPKPKQDKRYLNFEINPIGTLLLGIGEQRENRILIDDLDLDIFQINTSVNIDNLEHFNNDYWTVKYSIPFSFMEKYYGNLELTSGSIIKGNFYKCGDETEYPHFACWNPIQALQPDFHRPEYFGDLILE